MFSPLRTTGPFIACTTLNTFCKLSVSKMVVTGRDNLFWCDWQVQRASLVVRASLALPAGATTANQISLVSKEVSESGVQGHDVIKPTWYGRYFTENMNGSRSWFWA